MGYGVSRIMGYGFEIPAYQAGGQTKPWDIRGYGLSRLWVKRGSTVYTFNIVLSSNSYKVPPHVKDAESAVNDLPQVYPRHWKVDGPL